LLRSVYFWTVIITSTIIAFPIVILSLPFNRKGRIIQFYANLWGRLGLLTSGVKLQINGMENIRKDKPHIFMSNHQSIYDTLSLITLPVPIIWIAKRELFKIPILGWLMILGGCVSIDRFNPRSALTGMNSVQNKIKNGASVVIFPEGTRSYDGTVQSFKRGGFVIAVRTGTPIVPTTIIGSDKVMRRGTKKVNPGRIKIIIDKPIETAGLELKDENNLVQRVHEIISNRLSENVPS